jgi:tetratricopeptide (TPR) repeat protein
VLIAQGDYAAALHELEAAIQLAPSGQYHSISATWRIAVLLRLGEYEQARAAFEPLWAEHRYSDPESLSLVLGYEALGHRRDAEQLAQRLAHDSTIEPFLVFTLHASLGENDEALRWLRRAIDDRSENVQYLRLPNQFPDLQEQPGYAELLTYLDSIQKSR